MKKEANLSWTNAPEEGDKSILSEENELNIIKENIHKMKTNKINTK